MKEQKFLFILVVAFVFAITSCGDGDSGFIAHDDDSSLEEDSSDSDGDEGSVDSKSGSSSSKKGSSSSKKGSSSSGSSSSAGSSSSRNLPDDSKIEKGTFTDKRDGREYRTITVDGMTWMAQNLNYAPASSLGCHEGDNKDCTKHGRIYTWGEVIDSTKSYCGHNIVCDQPLQGICPDGWRIPTRGDWLALLNKFYGSTPTFYEYKGLAPSLFSKDNASSYQGTDDYGFTVAIPEKGTNKSAALNFFTATQTSGSENITPYFMAFDSKNIKDKAATNFASPAALRCIKGDLVPDINNPTSTFGVRGEDRKVCNGAEPNSSLSTRACNKNGENKCSIYEDGSLKINGRYVYLEANGKKACPFGWHIPRESEWKELLAYVGGECFAGFMLKAQEGWGEDYAFDAFGLGIKPTDGNEARFLIGGNKKGEITGSVVFAKGSNIATIKNDTANVSGLLCMKGRLKDDTLSYMNPELEYGEFTDSRDNRTYKTINIGHTKWMAENLNFETDSSVCYNGTRDVNSFSCMRYGRFYRHEDAMTACPAGWHLPTKDDFDTLMYLAAHNKKARYLVSQENDTQKGTNSSGFSLIMMGYIWNGRDDFGDTATYLWSSTELNDSLVYALSAHKVGYADDSAFVSKANAKGNTKFNVRCVSEEKVVYGYKGTYGTLVDERDGHEYKTIEINGTTWMAENLKYVSDNSLCKKDSCDIYGLHYTYPFDSTGSICPDGWHVSTTADWDSLLAYAKANDSAAYAIDLRYTFSWPWYNQGTDKYGFAVIPNTCYQDHEGYDMVNVRDEAVACIGAEDVDNDAGYYYIMSSNGVNDVRKTVFKRPVRKSDNNRFRFGIRCVKD